MVIELLVFDYYHNNNPLRNNIIEICVSAVMPQNIHVFKNYRAYILPPINIKIIVSNVKELKPILVMKVRVYTHAKYINFRFLVRLSADLCHFTYGMSSSI